MSRCPHCNALAVRHPSRGWHVAHVLGWFYAFGSVFGASLTGPLMVALAPPLVLGGACLLAETYYRATAPGECEACGKYVTARHVPTKPREIPRHAMPAFR